MVGSDRARRLRRIADRYGSAGGALLAGGLAYSALFAVVPAVVLVLGLVGLLLGEDADRTAVAEAIGRAIPPLRPLLEPALDELAGLSASMSVLGLAVLVWGASRFASSLEIALALVFGGPGRRGLVGRQLFAFASVVALCLAVVAGSVMTGLASLVEASRLAGLAELADPLLGAALTLFAPGAGVVALALAYRFVPPRAPRWRSIVLPALTVGLVLALGTQAFVVLAPRLVGTAAVLGTLAAAFAALAWFGVTFQVLLLGAAWVAERELDG